MKKFLFILLLMIIAISATACLPFKIIIEYEAPEITEPVTADGLWDGVQPEYGRTADGIGYVAADGYKWAYPDETLLCGELLYLGCNDCIDNWKQVPMTWKVPTE